MKYLQPDYYDLFSCTAGACENTCCMGWKIAIDEETLSLYEAMPGKFGDRVRKSVDWREECLLQKGNRCVLLNGYGLCDIQKNCGHEALCESCREYPRHVEEFPEVREYSLSLSCPEAARFILTGSSSYARGLDTSEYGIIRPGSGTSKHNIVRPGHISLCRILKRDTEERDDLEYEDFDGKLYAFMLELRDWMREVLSCPEMTLHHKRMTLREVSQTIQDLLDEEYLEKDYISDEFLERARACLKDIMEQDISGLERDSSRFLPEKQNSDEKDNFFFSNETADYNRMKQEFRLLEKLYPIDPSWPGHREKMYRVLYKNSEGTYQKLQAEFEEWCRNNSSMLSDKGNSSCNEPHPAGIKEGLEDIRCGIQDEAERMEDIRCGIQDKAEGMEDIHYCIQDELEQMEVRIIDYYLYVYLAGAVYDGDILSKTNLALYSGHRLREAAFYCWLENVKTVTDKVRTDKTRIDKAVTDKAGADTIRKDKVPVLPDLALNISRYAREIEHADENLEILIEEVNNIWQ